MSKFMVKGGYSLFGEININGAKNAALPILCASILNKGTTTLNNIPKLSDTKTAVDILKALGCKITEFDKTLVIDSTSITSCKVPTELMSKMRCSIIFLGALTARLGEAEIAYPGGCCLGSRPIDLHLKALKKLGVEISEKNGIIKSKSVNPIGGKITLSFPSVGATQNSILAAVCANGLTNIKNAAKEPEVTDLCCFLNKMGADIDYSDKDEIKITGPCQFHDCEYSIISDRIEAGTYMCAVASTGGDVALNNINPNYIQSLSDILKQMGCDITALKNGIRIKSSKNLKAVSNIETGPYPLFPTDMQAQLMAVMASAYR